MKHFVWMIVAVGLAGCATAGESRIVLTQLDPIVAEKPEPFPYEGNIVVEGVSGLEKSVRVMGNEVLSGEEFSQALTTTLRAEGMLSDSPTGANYRLSVSKVNLDTPYKISLSHSGHATFRYVLTRVSDGAVVFDKQVDTSATLTVDDDYDGAKRLVNAGRVAVRDNIRKAVKLMITEPAQQATR